jgi:hypothetical protein
MEQKYEGAPKAEIKVEGRRVTRSDVANDWGLQLLWVVSKDGKVVAQVNARTEPTYEHPDKTPGNYEIVLQIWKYMNYAKDAKGEFTQSKFVDVSNKVIYKI